MLRKAIDYFCHLAVAPEFLAKIKKGDKAFVESEFFDKMKWMADVNDDIYDPTYTDMLRVAFTSEFGRGKLQDLVALLSGRNFETKQYEEAIAEESFGRLKNGILAFINKTHFDRITMILRSAGFITSKLINSQNAVNFAYILYLRGRAENVPRTIWNARCAAGMPCRCCADDTAGRRSRRSISTSARSAVRGVVAYVDAVVPNELPDSFWTGMLPQFMDTSSINSPYFLCYQAAQAKLGDKGFLSRDITVTDLLLNRADVHHVYPRQHLKRPETDEGDVQPDRQLRRGAERDQHRHRGQAASQSTSRNWPSSATAGRRNTAGSRTKRKWQPILRRIASRRRCWMGRSRTLVRCCCAVKIDPFSRVVRAEN